MSIDPANQVIILGGGMIRNPEGVGLSAASMQRVDKGIEYWNVNRHSFGSDDAIILCSGGFGLFAAGVEAPKDGTREARLMAGIMVKAGVPHTLIEVEDESYSTVTNWTESIRRGFIDPASYDASHQLGVVTHKNHFKRASDSARRLGFPKNALQGILVHDGAIGMFETGIRLAYALGNIGTHGSEELIKRDRMIADILTLGRKTKEL